MGSRKWPRLRFIPSMILSFMAGFIVSFILFNFLSTDTNNSIPNDHQLMINNNDPSSYFMVAIIFSSVRNVARRNTIRNTWVLLGEKLSFKYYFIIGTDGLSTQIKNELITEQKQNENDLILISQLSDTYHNLTLKLLRSIQWLNSNAEFRYLLKVDDDSFVRIDALYRYLKENDQSKINDKLPLYMGFFDGRAHVKQKGVWKEKDWFLCDRYLPYALGGGYILQSELVKFIIRNEPMLKHYRSEDVSLGTWLAPLSIERRHDLRFDTEYRTRGCVNSFLVQHKQSTIDMETKYDSLIKYGKLCPKKEFENRPTYQYNWNVLPSKCCIRNVTMIKS